MSKPPSNAVKEQFETKDKLVAAVQKLATSDLWLDRDWMKTALEQCLSQPWSLMVLHDDFTRALPALERFLPAVKEAGARFRQDFPPACVPLHQGHIIGPLDHLIAT